MMHSFRNDEDNNKTISSQENAWIDNKKMHIPKEKKSNNTIKIPQIQEIPPKELTRWERGQEIIQ